MFRKIRNFFKKQEIETQPITMLFVVKTCPYCGRKEKFAGDLSFTFHEEICSAHCIENKVDKYDFKIVFVISGIRQIVYNCFTNELDKGECCKSVYHKVKMISSFLEGI